MTTVGKEIYLEDRKNVDDFVPISKLRFAFLGDYFMI